MRQLSVLNEANGVTNGEACVRFVHVGPVRRWEVMISVWDRFQHVQMLDREQAFCSIADRLRDYPRDDVAVRILVFDRRHRRVSPSVFVHPEMMEELLAGCLELRLMIDSDVAGEFRFGSLSPLLTADEERIVRQTMRDVEKAAAEQFGQPTGRRQGSQSHRTAASVTSTRTPTASRLTN